MKSKPSNKKSGSGQGQKRTGGKPSQAAKKSSKKPTLVFGEVVAVKQVDEKSLRVVGCLGSGSGLGSY